MYDREAWKKYIEEIPDDDPILNGLRIVVKRGGNEALQNERLVSAVLADSTENRREYELYRNLVVNACRCGAVSDMMRSIGKEFAAEVCLVKSSEILIGKNGISEKYAYSVMYYFAVLFGIADELKPDAAAEDEDYSGFPESVRKLMTAAGKDDAAAQCDLGYAFDTGKDVPQDYSKAAKYYRLSAEQGNMYAQFNLGIMYDNGKAYRRIFPKR